MKRVRIAKGKVALVMKRGEYQRCLVDGVYWIGFFENVVIYDMALPFLPHIELNILLQDAKLASLLDVIEVKDHEVALVYKDGISQEVLRPGRYAFFKGVCEFTFQKMDLSKPEITEEIGLNTLMKVSVLPYVRTFEVLSYEKGLLFKEGKYVKDLEPGTYRFWRNAINIEVKKADLRLLQQDVLGQEILTKDKANIRVNFHTAYRIVDIHQALIENKVYDTQLYSHVQLALREYVGTLTLDELLDKKEAVSEFVREALKEKSESLGLEIKDCGIKDIILPGDIKEIMNKVLVAQKTAQANTITRREETASTRSLMNTAKLMEENEMLFKLKEMEYMEKIADKINSITLSGGSQVLDQLRDIFTK
ncbi:MAG: slipin family protein [Bacteroidota bacterium]